MIAPDSLPDSGLRMNECCSLRICTPEGYPPDVQRMAREIIEVYTLPELRGQGFAKELMEKVCAEADASAMALLIHVEPSDETTEKIRLQKFYAKFGFAVFQSEPLLMCRTPKGSAH